MMRMATVVVAVWMHLHSLLQVKDIMLITGVVVQEVVNLDM
jgi:hypothetical protein